ncbi:hypothetical protein HaLaN_27121 [Haematococcus lacustris]|uniref:Uncharacterized protein n=1 Tax=Haematococcus lacustris TaxID=44745 RepID=A0A6A0A8U1_HAELA|nr:hypothetical protein HaLaN_27121 [Haematococcus lacustris]
MAAPIFFGSQAVSDADAHLYPSYSAEQVALANAAAARRGWILGMFSASPPPRTAPPSRPLAAATSLPLPAAPPSPPPPQQLTPLAAAVAAARDVAQAQARAQRLRRQEQQQEVIQVPAMHPPPQLESQRVSHPPREAVSVVVAAEVMWEEAPRDAVSPVTHPQLLASMPPVPRPLALRAARPSQSGEPQGRTSLAGSLRTSLAGNEAPSPADAELCEPALPPPPKPSLSTGATAACISPQPALTVGRSRPSSGTSSRPSSGLPHRLSRSATPDAAMDRASAPSSQRVSGSGTAPNTMQLPGATVPTPSALTSLAASQVTTAAAAAAVLRPAIEARRAGLGSGRHSHLAATGQALDSPTAPSTGPPSPSPLSLSAVVVAADVEQPPREVPAAVPSSTRPPSALVLGASSSNPPMAMATREATKLTSRMPSSNTSVPLRPPAVPTAPASVAVPAPTPTAAIDGTLASSTVPVAALAVEAMKIPAPAPALSLSPTVAAAPAVAAAPPAAPALTPPPAGASAPPSQPATPAVTSVVGPPLVPLLPVTPSHQQTTSAPTTGPLPAWVVPAKNLPSVPGITIPSSEPVTQAAAVPAVALPLDSVWAVKCPMPSPELPTQSTSPAAKAATATPAAVSGAAMPRVTRIAVPASGAGTSVDDGEDLDAEEVAGRVDSSAVMKGNRNRGTKGKASSGEEGSCPK